MSKKDSLIAAYLLDGDGGGKKIGWKEVDQWAPEQGILWVHLNYSTQGSVRWLNKSSGLDKITAHAMAVEESRPRSVISSKGVLVFLRGVNHNPGEDPEDMVSIRVWIDEHRIISTRKRQLLSINDIRASIDESCGPKTPGEFLRMLNDRLINRMGDVIESVDEHVDQLEQEVATAESRLLRPRIADIRCQAIMIRRYLAPQREALNRLYLEETSFLTSVDRVYLREAADRVIRYIEDLDAARDRAIIIQEELTSRLQEQLDRRMFVLSIVAVIFLPLTFITGLLGINVGGIPGKDSPWAFLIVCLALFGMSAVTFWWLRRKKWI